MSDHPIAPEPRRKSTKRRAPSFPGWLVWIAASVGLSLALWALATGIVLGLNHVVGVPQPTEPAYELSNIVLVKLNFDLPALLLLYLPIVAWAATSSRPRRFRLVAVVASPLSAPLTVLLPWARFYDLQYIVLVGGVLAMGLLVTNPFSRRTAGSDRGMEAASSLHLRLRVFAFVLVLLVTLLNAGYLYVSPMAALPLAAPPLASMATLLRGRRAGVRSRAIDLVAAGQVGVSAVLFVWASELSDPAALWICGVSATAAIALVASGIRKAS